MVWAKGRSVAYNHFVADIVRGTNANLVTNNTNQEANPTNGLIYSSGGIGQVTANGFTVVANGTDGDNLNQNAATYVAWAWKANGTGVTNTAGSITSTVSANTTSGFSVVTYTGNGSAYPTGATIGHGLGVSPSMIIVKSRSTSSTNWSVYHSSLGASSSVILNGTGAASSPADAFNRTSPTSTVFSVGQTGGGSRTNENTSTYVAYCFSEVAGYSKFGSYTGNGSSDGTFVATGFLPKFIMIKRTDSTSDWVLYDTVRETYNTMDAWLNPNTSGAEVVGTAYLDALSNGFKWRYSGAQNASGGSYIYMAFAEVPQKFSLGR
jgi:hypothetical protein